MTQEEAIKFLNGYMAGRINPESIEFYSAVEFVVDILESQPSLPSNLNEAAEEYSDEHSFHFCDYDITPYDAFKAGAEWMAGQGVTKDVVVRRTPLNGPIGIEAFLNNDKDFKEGDKVVAQIRKK